MGEKRVFKRSSQIHLVFSIKAEIFGMGMFKNLSYYNLELLLPNNLNSFERLVGKWAEQSKHL